MCVWNFTPSAPHSTATSTILQALPKLPSWFMPASAIRKTGDPASLTAILHHPDGLRVVGKLVQREPCLRDPSARVVHPVIVRQPRDRRIGRRRPSSIER